MSLGRGESKRWIAVAVIAVSLAGLVQHHVESQRKERALTWAESDKNALEAGFLALGGFRGILADVLWLRAIGQQDAARYYEIRSICDLILKLQPTFTGVHAFQAYNMSYNLAYRAESCEDKWYWIRSGLATLEKGLERNSKNYSLWFELGYQYFDRLGDIKMADCASFRDKQLPQLKDIPEDQRSRLWLGDQSSESKWKAGAPSNEHLRFAAYYFWKAMHTGNDPVPIRTERQFGQCIEHLGHYYSANKPPEQRDWYEWGAEDWWVELIKRTEQRQEPVNDIVPNNLRFCMYQQMDSYLGRTERQRAKGDWLDAEKSETAAKNAYQRFKKYFPENKKSMGELLASYRQYRDRPGATRPANIAPEPIDR